VHVVYGFPNRKIHAKITLLIRREGRELRRYAHIGTGNYNARTARSYEDLGLFTANEEITADLADLFNYLTGFGKPQRFRKLLVAPFDVRSGLIKEIRAVADAATAGKAARIRIKANSLIDVAIIDELYRASSAGARIDIVTRSICALRPGVPGLSENIRVRSVLGPFLEHSRFSIFNAGPSVTCYMGSADLMPRNLDHRIEVLAPVEDVKARDELVAVFDALLADNRFAWELDAAGSWRRVTPKKDDRDRGAQMVLMRRARTRARRWAAARSRKR
jgi:polyphosphate kinase